MRRIDVSSAGRVSIDGTASGEHLDLASADDVTFPGVWLGGAREYDVRRQYDVEAWRDGAAAEVRARQRSG